MSRKQQVVKVGLGEKSYEILIGEGLLSQATSFEGLGRNAQALIVTNDVVAPLYAHKLAAALTPLFSAVRVLELPDGEAHKGWASANKIFEFLLSWECDRQTVIFALGGGVVGDIAGFAAACYMRGISFVQVPTTLLAQVDSSVGGKTAINHALGKNMIGAFHQPLRVISDTDVLKSLPDREVTAGLAEVIKYGPIADDEFLSWIEANIDSLRARNKVALAHAIKRSCEIKAQIVESDERESGLRAILNFGHTFGHAIEAGLGYGAWLHGEAVGCGMVMAAELSHRLGLVSSEYAKRLIAVIGRAGLPTRGPAEISPDRYLELMRVDKKAEGGQIRFVVIEEPGRAALRSVPDNFVRDAICAHT